MPTKHPDLKLRPFQPGDFCILSDRFGEHDPVVARVKTLRGRGHNREQTLEILAADGSVAQTVDFKVAYYATCREATLTGEGSKFTHAVSITTARKSVESFKCNRITDPDYSRLRKRNDVYERLLRLVPYTAI